MKVLCDTKRQGGIVDTNYGYAKTLRMGKPPTREKEGEVDRQT